jgi:4'-phosphopantetheinyl transferase
MERPQLFLMPTDDETDLLERLPFELPADQYETARSYRKANDRNNFVAARWLLVEFFKEQRVDFNLNELQYTDAGKPFLNNGYHFSIAHTKGMVGILVGTTPVGLDIELIKHIENYYEFSEVLTATELDTIARSGLQTFFRFWTAKEAILKLTGDGIVNSGLVNSIIFTEPNIAVIKEQTFSLQPFMIHDNIFVTIAQLHSLAASVTDYFFVTENSAMQCLKLDQVVLFQTVNFR